MIERATALRMRMTATAGAAETRKMPTAGSVPLSPAAVVVQPITNNNNNDNNVACATTDSTRSSAADAAEESMTAFQCHILWMTVSSSDAM